MRIAGWILVAGGMCAAPLAAQTPQPPTQDTTKPKPPPRIDISKLKFMSGCWEGTTGKDQRAEEIWTMPAENLLTSTTRYFEKERASRSEEHTSELQSQSKLVCRLLLEKKNPDKEPL